MTRPPDLESWHPTRCQKAARRPSHRPPARRALSAGQLPDVAGWAMTWGARDAEQDEVERHHHRRLPGDQPQVAQCGEEVAEAHHVDETHDQVGAGEGRSRQDAQVSERHDEHHQQHAVLQRLKPLPAAVGVERQRIEQHHVHVSREVERALRVAHAAAAEPSAMALVVLVDLGEVDRAVEAGQEVERQEHDHGHQHGEEHEGGRTASRLELT